MQPMNNRVFLVVFTAVIFVALFLLAVTGMYWVRPFYKPHILMVLAPLFAGLAFLAASSISRLITKAEEKGKLEVANQKLEEEKNQLEARLKKLEEEFPAIINTQLAEFWGFIQEFIVLVISLKINRSASGETEISMTIPFENLEPLRDELIIAPHAEGSSESKGGMKLSEFELEVRIKQGKASLTLVLPTGFTDGCKALCFKHAFQVGPNLRILAISRDLPAPTVASLKT